MTVWSELAIPETPVERRARVHATVIASRWADVRSAWTRSLARHRLQRSIAHLDDRLLADIGLGPQDLGFAERFARRDAIATAFGAKSKMASTAGQLANDHCSSRPCDSISLHSPMTLYV
jgi:uncharacterized protein YjiS (DUF1127 family)